MVPRRRQPVEPVQIEAVLLRPEDLLVARLTAPDCALSVVEGRAVLVPTGPNASLVLHLPPQHLGERAWPEGTVPARQSAHRAAAPTRLVFALPQDARVPFTLDGVLSVLPQLPLRVVPHAAPAGDVEDDPSFPASGGIGPLLLTGLDDFAEWMIAARVRRASARGIGAVSRLRHGVDVGSLAPWRPPVRMGGPRPPGDLETSIEVPYRVQVSPSVRGAFSHAPTPTAAPQDATRVELWRTHLTVRLQDGAGAFAGVDDTDEHERIVRAVWSRDLDEADATAATDPLALNSQSLRPPERRALVRETSDTTIPAALRPLQVRSLALSSLGAWVDWTASWDPNVVPDPTPDPLHGLLLDKLDAYRHLAVMGRDQYVRVSKPGFLYPFGHRASWVRVTERKVLAADDAAAYLWAREFIVVRQPVRTFAGHDSPWVQVALEPVTTPDLDPVAVLDQPVLPHRQGRPYAFTLVATDRAGTVRTFQAPLVFVADTALSSATLQADTDALYAAVERIPGRGQAVAVAAPRTAGDTDLEVNHLRFRGTIDAAAHTSRPWLLDLNAVVPSMRHLAPQAPGVDLAYAAAFLSDPDGFGPGNPAQLFLRASGSPPAVDFTAGSDRSGGFLAPNLVVRALSRSLGAVGDDGSAPVGLASGHFDATSFLAGALPKMFGLFTLLDVLDLAGLDLDKAPSFVTEALDTVQELHSEALRLQRASQDVLPRLDQEIGLAPHGGSAAALQSARQQAEGLVAALAGEVQALLDALASLPTTRDVGAVTDALDRTASRGAALLAALRDPAVPMALRVAVERPARTLAALHAATGTLRALQDLLTGVLSPSTSVTARYEWRPTLRSWPAPPSTPVIEFRDLQGLRLAVEVRAGASGPPRADVAAELSNFALQLLPGEPLMAMTFTRLGFRVSSGGKPEVDVVFGGMEFLGALGFVDTLRRMIPFDGFSDPPYVDVSPEGAVAGFDLALPNVSVGVFSLENIALGAEARVPFLGDAVTVGFHFCSKDSPFRLTVMAIGGGGWLELRAAPKGLVLLELGLEAAACLSVDLGVASGSVSVSVGVYLRLEGDKGLLTAYFRIRGEVDVLGLISASITLELSLAYRFDTGKLVGRASLVVEVEVLFFSASVEITVERQLAGSKGDPTLYEVMPPDPDGTNADWRAYCEAFAPLP